MSDFTVTDLLDVLENRVALSEAAHEHPKIPNLFFLAAPASASPEEIDADKMALLIADARENFEYTVIDCPAGIGAGFRLAAKSADAAIIVATGDVSSIRDASVAVARLIDMTIPEVRLLVNRFDGRRARRLRETVDDMIDDAGARLIGIVREDERVPDAVSDDTPLVLYGGTGAARDFLDVARRLTGEELPI
jgi:septum site-determining protein MinD